MRNSMRGFTLIELMIVVVILGIIAGIALPAYQSQIRDARRADAGTVLMQARQLMERHYSKTFSYQGVPAGTIPVKAPIDGTDQFYVITVATPNATTFTLTATPQGDQVNDACGNLTINQAGAKTAAGSIDDCWR